MKGLSAGNREMKWVRKGGLVGCSKALQSDSTGNR